MKTFTTIVVFGKIFDEIFTIISTFVEVICNNEERFFGTVLLEKIDKIISVVNPSIAPTFRKTYLETYYVLR